MLSLAGVLARPGTYDVLVQKQGYIDWRAHDIDVVVENCALIPVTLQAQLVLSN